MHLRVSKALKAGFDLKTAENIANMDWAEDITAFSGDADCRRHPSRKLLAFKCSRPRVLGPGGLNELRFKNGCTKPGR